MRTLPLLLVVACTAADPDAFDPESAFPWVWTPETELQAYEQIRWEAQPWDPVADPESTALYLLKAVQHRPGAPPETLDHFAAMRPAIPPLGRGVRLSFVGDVMWLSSNHASFALPAAPLLDGDLRLGNLETPTSPYHPTGLAQLGLYAFNSPPELLDGLPLDVLQLNNNHTLDAGDDGLDATLLEVSARGLVQTGVDAHATVEVDGRTIALLSYTWGINAATTPTAHDLYVVPFGRLDQPLDLDGVAADVAAARAAGTDTVVLMLHWGFEYEDYPDPHFLQLGRRLVEAGADLVVGTGPHVVQPPEICRVNPVDPQAGVGRCDVVTADGVPRTAAILYSLGNFDTIQPTPQCQTGLVATVSVDPDVTGLGWAGVANVDRDGRPVVAPLVEVAADDPVFAEEAARLAAHVGDGWRR